MQSYDQYTYEPLDFGTDSLRLLTLTGYDCDGYITCSLRNARISESQYLALSYTWGTDVGDSSIIVDGQVMHIQPNLYAFLEDFSQQAALSTRRIYFDETTPEPFLGNELLRTHGTIPEHHKQVREIWIDAICLDQSNLRERNHQVQQMHSIYRNAQCVLVWLGRDDIEIKYWLSALIRWSESTPDPFDDPRVHHHLSREWFAARKLWGSKSMYDFLQLQYWSRMWIIQELASAKNIVLLYEWYTIHWTLFWSTFDKLRITSIQGPFDYARSRAYKHHRLSQKLAGQKTLTLWQLLEEFEMLKCSNDQDRIYALASLVEEGDIFPVDYTNDSIQLAARVVSHFDLQDTFTRFEQIINVLRTKDKEFDKYIIQARRMSVASSRGRKSLPQSPLQIAGDTQVSTYQCPICKEHIPHIYEVFEDNTSMICLPKLNAKGHVFLTPKLRKGDYARGTAAWSFWVGPLHSDSSYKAASLWLRDYFEVDTFRTK